VVADAVAQPWRHMVGVLVLLRVPKISPHLLKRSRHCQTQWPLDVAAAELQWVAAAAVVAEDAVEAIDGERSKG